MSISVLNHLDEMSTEDEDSLSIGLLIDEFQKAKVTSDVELEHNDDTRKVETDTAYDGTRITSNTSSPSPDFTTGLNAERKSTPLTTASSSPSTDGAGVFGAEGQFFQDLTVMPKPPPSELWLIPGKLDYIANILNKNQIQHPHSINFKMPRDPALRVGIGCLTQETIHTCIHNLRTIQDMLMLADDTELDRRRELCMHAAGLEQEYLKYLYWQVLPIYPENYLQGMMGDEGSGPGRRVSLGTFSGLVDASTSTCGTFNHHAYLNHSVHVVSMAPSAETILKHPKIVPTTWCGVLPKPRYDETTIYSSKVFLGGLPCDMSNDAIVHCLSPFGRIQRIERLNGGRESMYFAYVIFEREEQVHQLLSRCKKDPCDDAKWFINVPSGRGHALMKPVEVVPWSLANNRFQVTPIPANKDDHGDAFTVFVGGAHGTLNAEGLAFIFQQLFGGVQRTRIDTDRLQYPIGSGQVVFQNYRSYFAAVSAQFLEIRTNKFHKVFQVDPYLIGGAACSYCNHPDGPLFCRDLACFRHHCYSCYQKVHERHPENTHQPPLFRKLSVHQHHLTSSVGAPPGLPQQGLNRDFDVTFPPPSFQTPCSSNMSSPVTPVPLPSNGNGSGPRMDRIRHNGQEGTFHPIQPSSSGSGLNSVGFHVTPWGDGGSTPSGPHHVNPGSGRGLAGWIRGKRGFRFANSLRPRNLYHP